MKICTACNESFNDEFNFCEVCGAKLQRHQDPSAPPAKRDWSLLGIALVLGAVLVTVASIIFTPKARLTDNQMKESVAVATPPQSSPLASPSAASDLPANADSSTPASEEAELTDEEAAKAEAEAKKKEKEKAAKAAEAKEAAAREAEAKATASEDVNPKAAKEAVQPAEPVRPKVEAKPEPVAAEPKEESRPRSVAAPPEPKEVKKPTEEPKATTKPDDKKKDDKKKKGGFFGVFKKIFGKDN